MSNSNNPIALWMTSRSRSSMISSIFDKHGVYTGNDGTTSAGYVTYENQKLRKLQKSLWKIPLYSTIQPNDPRIPGFTKLVLQYVPSDQQWSVKTGIEYFHAYQPLNPYNIYITRDYKDIAQSRFNKVKGTDLEEAEQVAKWRLELMESHYYDNGGIFVNTDNIIAGDYSEIKYAIEYCNIEFDLDATERAIK